MLDDESFADLGNDHWFINKVFSLLVRGLLEETW